MANELENLNDRFVALEASFEQIGSVNQSLADSAQILESAESAVSSSVETISSALSDLSMDWQGKVLSGSLDVNSDIEKNLEQFESLQANGETLKEALSELMDESEGLGETINDSWDLIEENLSEFWDSFDRLDETLASRLEEEFGELLESTSNVFSEVGASIEEHIEQKWKSDSQEILEECLDVFSNLKDEIANALSETGQNIEEILKQSAERLVGDFEDLGDEITNEVMDAVKTYLEEVLQSKAEEMIEASTIGAQVTAIIQPYLPQLLVANAVAPAVQQALNAMRMV